MLVKPTFLETVQYKVNDIFDDLVIAYIIGAVILLTVLFQMRMQYAFFITAIVIFYGPVIWIGWPKKTGVLSVMIVKRPTQAEIDAAFAKERAEERARVARKVAREKRWTVCSSRCPRSYSSWYP